MVVVGLTKSDESLGRQEMSLLRHPVAVDTDLFSGSYLEAKTGRVIDVEPALTWAAGAIRAAATRQIEGVTPRLEIDHLWGAGAERTQTLAGSSGQDKGDIDRRVPIIAACWAYFGKRAPGRIAIDASSTTRQPAQ